MEQDYGTIDSCLYIFLLICTIDMLMQEYISNKNLGFREKSLIFPIYPEKGPDSTRVFAFLCTLYTVFCKNSVTPVFVHEFLVKLKCSFKFHHMLNHFSNTIFNLHWI